MKSLTFHQRRTWHWPGWLGQLKRGWRYVDGHITLEAWVSGRSFMVARPVNPDISRARFLKVLAQMTERLHDQVELQFGTRYLLDHPIR